MEQIPLSAHMFPA